MLLGVNIDHVATLREARGTRYPSLIHAALEAELGGADGITCHLREDRRHIQDRDVSQLMELTQTRLNLEMAATENMQRIAVELKPHACCLVPEKREELTTEGGLDVVTYQTKIQDTCHALAQAGVRVSLFIDADPAQIEAAVVVGAPVIEIHTGHFADSQGTAQQQELNRIKTAVTLARNAGLIVHAGHGLHYHNVADIAAIPGISELNIGHAIIARAVFSGLQNAVADIKNLMLTAAGENRHD